MAFAIDLGDNFLGSYWDSIWCGKACEKDRIKMKLDADQKALETQSQMAYMAAREQALLGADAKKRTVLIIGGIVLILAIIGAVVFLTMNTDSE